MRCYYFFLASLVCASNGQSIDIVGIEQASYVGFQGPLPGTEAQKPSEIYSSSDVVSNVLKHGFDASIIRRSRVARSLKDNGCTSEPSSDLPEVKPDTPEAFTFFKPFAALAKNASTPAGYDLSFSNMQKSISMSAYMGLQTLQTYDVSLCAKTCNATAACLGFNIFIKRNPSVSPAKPCPNPPSVPIVQCTLWGSPVLPGAATNGGEYLPPTDKNGDTFRSVITASNGYSKLGGPPTLKGFNGPVALHGAVNATKLIDPMTNKTSDIFIGTKFFRQPFDPAVCAALCNKTTETNKEAAQEQTEKGEGFNYMPCNSFNAYVLSLDGVPQGLYCALYALLVDFSVGTIKGTTANNHMYAVSQSYVYTLDPQDRGVVKSAE